VIDFYGLLGLLDAFVRDQWPGFIVGILVAFAFTGYVYERFSVKH
jgi:hypothetical protein